MTRCRGSRCTGKSPAPQNGPIEIHEPRGITDNDRCQFSERIRTLKAILAKLRPEPVREPLPPPKVYAPPRETGNLPTIYLCQKLVGHLDDRVPVSQDLKMKCHGSSTFGKRMHHVWRKPA